MYKKDTALEIQFAPERLNDGAGAPYWIDLSTQEAQRLLLQLQAHFAQNPGPVGSAPVFELGEPYGEADSTAPNPGLSAAGAQAPASEFKQWICLICGWIYDEAAGLPEDGIAPGTRWEAIPDSWRCPLCDVGKNDFVLVQF